MRKVIFTVTVLSVLSGCASDGSFMGIGGRNTVSDGGMAVNEPYQTRSSRWNSDEAVPGQGEYWPPVAPGQAFPPQEMSD